MLFILLTVLLMQPSFQSTLHDSKTQTIAFPEFDSEGIDSIDVPDDSEDYYPNSNKRYFTSQGWGPSGLPYQGVYFNAYTPENRLAMFRAQQLAQGIKEEDIDYSEYPYGRLIVALHKKANLETPTSKESLERYLKKDDFPRDVVNMPYFFRSFGWRPAGQK